MSLQSVNPFNGEILSTFEEEKPEETRQKIESAHQAYLNWRETSFEERAKHMHKCAEVLRENKQPYAETMTREMGKVISESLAEVEKCATVCDYYAQNASKFLSDEDLTVPEGKAFIQYAPLGVVLAVMPWNFPLWQVYRFAAPGLMAGNAGLLKHASNVMMCAEIIQETFIKAGFPEGLFQNLKIKSGSVSDVIDHSHVKAVTLTGSEGAGSAVASQAGKNIKKSVLELGGSDPFIVLADAPIQKTAQIAAKSRMINCGQSCIAAKRFIIEKDIAEDFLNAFKDEIKNLRKGDPMDSSTDYASMARTDLAQELYDQVDKSIQKGASLAYGELGDRPQNAHFAPLILTDVKPGMPAYDEELFGPVATVMIADNTKEAIKLANDSPFGLGGSVWTADEAKGIDVARKVQCGAVYVNKMMASDPHVPFGGVKISGYGRELSHLGIREFVNQKTIWVD